MACELGLRAVAAFAIGTADLPKLESTARQRGHPPECRRPGGSLILLKGFPDFRNRPHQKYTSRTLAGVYCAFFFNIMTLFPDRFHLALCIQKIPKFRSSGVS